MILSLRSLKREVTFNFTLIELFTLVELLNPLVQIFRFCRYCTLRVLHTLKNTKLTSEIQQPIASKIWNNQAKGSEDSDRRNQRLLTIV